ncbi:MAG: hypothetical protein AAFR88_02465 [Pseudomonadota bacterium]
MKPLVAARVISEEQPRAAPLIEAIAQIAPHLALMPRILCRVSSLSDADFDPDALIRQAYSVVAEPQKLFDLQTRLERAEARSGEAVAALDQHFEQIGALFDTIHHGPEADYSKLGLLSPDEAMESAPVSDLGTAVVLRLSEDWRVVSASGALGGALSIGAHAPEWLVGYRREVFTRLRKGFQSNGASAHYVRLYASEEDERGFMALARAGDFEGEPALGFTQVSLAWDALAGARFAETMDLTPTETELTRFIVEGRSISEFAQARERSVGTARNQMKALLKKLGIGSQSELVSLYAGFSHSLALSQHAWPNEEPAAFGASVTLRDGSAMRFERYGKAGGKPVLVLHGVIEGPFMTANLAHQAHQAGLEFFVPWMPFHEGRESARNPQAMIELFAKRLEMFCAELRIERCAVLACSLSCAYGLAALRATPHLYRGMVMCGFVPPLAQIEDDARLNPVWRAPLAVARSAPGMIDLMVRALVRLAMRGEAAVYFDKLLKDSPVDRATLRQPDVRSVVRRALANRPDKAGRAFAHAVLVQAQDWSEWLEGQEVRIACVLGEGDVVYKPEAMREFCERYGIEVIGPLADAGGFSMFQQPCRVFAEVRSLFDD